MVAEGPLTAAQIYEQLTGGEGTQSLIDAHDSTDQLGKRLAERAKQISKLAVKTTNGWQGSAGNAAADSTVPLVQAAVDDVVHLKNAQDAVEAQITAFGTAKNSVKPVSAQPQITAEDILGLFNGNGKSFQTKVAGWQADSQANIDAFRVYHYASTANGTQMPAQYAQLNDSGAPVVMDTGTPPPADKTTGRTTGTDGRQQTRAQTRQPGTPQQNQDRPATQTPNQYRPPTQPPNQVTGGRPAGSDQTHANSYVPKPVLPPAANGGYQFGPTGQPVSSLGPGDFGPYGSGGDFGPGAGYSGSGSGSGGYRGTGTGSGPGARNIGPGSGVGRGMPGEAVGRPGMGGGAPGSRGANGMPMGAPAAGQGKKEEDKEKKAAAYLRNPDPDGVFGGDIEKPMPPVIGERRPR
jgi:hypothetical protein